MSIEYRLISVNEYKKIIKLWNINIGCLFPIDDMLFYGNLKMDTNFNPNYVVGAYSDNDLIGFIIFKEYNIDGIARPSNEKVGNINSLIVDYKYRNKGIGSTLLRICEEKLRESGVKKIELGRDTFHFFPGVPIECQNLINLVKHIGYREESISWDLICDLKNTDIDEAINQKKIVLNNNFVIEALTEDYRESLMKFMKEEFPGRWYNDMKIFFGDGMEYRDIIIVKDNDEGKVIGFSHIYDKYSKVIGPSIYWRGLMGENFGGLGPIGISKKFRNKGLGINLFYRCVKTLQNRGVEKMCIDWTDLLNFYGILNFIPWKTYIHMNKKI
ncbi:GNAT family N-acetyltransferase [Thermoanaerobacterium thermosaccharolyticum]|uniref:GNAT family N-acetyltransferase n=1 Tax=Thermoanaerobacterium thermosaccharolyticum TaxID=1517 RepID=UPI0020A25B1F|nr:GNAT family N-acetyltransferase [Thermoanaerobacterium thermosaccharolyticum]MCP2241181.1 putative N-acetyltransferase YhbS [Thermoanaerobacterium thermosaccharolyticum]